MLSALFLWGLFTFFPLHHYETIRIQVDGEIYGTYSLLEDQIIAIGSTNVCEIKEGKLTMISSTCPDHLCMKQGAIDGSGGMIICLPNKITIEGEDSDPSQSSTSNVDAIAR